MRGIGNPDEFRSLSPAPMKGSDFFYAFSYQIQMQFRCNWRGSFGDKDDEVILVSLDEMRNVVIPYINIRIIQRPVLCHNMHRW